MKKKIKKHIAYLKIKLKELRDQFIPYNSAYKPSGLYITSQDFITAVKAKEPESAYVEIYSDLVSHLDLPTDFYQACFQPPKQAKTTYVVTAIEKGRIYSNHGTTIAIMSQDNHLIGDVSFAYNYGKVAPAQENSIFTQRYFKTPIKHKGVVFNMLSGYGAIDNYGHWLIDTLPRLHLLKKSGLYEKVDWFLMPAYKHDYQKDTLKLLGIDESKVIDGNQSLHLQADVLMASTAPRGSSSILPLWACHFLRDAFLNETTLTSTYPPLIYISRRDSMIRRVINEEEVITLLEGYGFKTYVLSNLPFIEKVKLFASAQVIIAATGAGMANTVFCKKGTKIVEIFSKAFVHHDNIDKANKLGLDYYYILGKEGKAPKSAWQVQREHVTINIEQLKKMLDQNIFKKSFHEKGKMNK
jgi:capsular polysaccharide biosynthesis protein